MTSRSRAGQSQYFYGHGKLLLTSEYFVLRGAQALALPTNKGQSLSVKTEHSFDPVLNWKSFDHQGKCWFEANFEFWHFDVLEENPSAEALELQKILRQVRRQNPHFLRDKESVFVETRLEFPLSWGLGSSSTLIYNIAQWAYVSPFELLFNTFGGSGYDIACAQSAGPIVFENGGKGPVWETVNFLPEFTSNLYFVHLERKQSSREGIQHFEQQSKNIDVEDLTFKLSQITRQLLDVRSLADFEFLISGHENLIASSLGLTTVKERLFSDYQGAIKSLGAWGGDFVLVTGTEDLKATADYFAKKGFPEIYRYNDLISPSSMGRVGNDVGLLQ